MPGLVPGIHVLGTATKVVDGRDKPGHDGCGSAGTQESRDTEENDRLNACLHSVTRDIARLRSWHLARSLTASTNKKSSWRERHGAPEIRSFPCPASPDRGASDAPVPARSRSRRAVGCARL